MKLLFKIWLVILIGAIVGIVVKQDSGYVLLSIGYYTVEMSFTFLLLMIFVVFFILYFKEYFKPSALELLDTIRLILIGEFLVFENCINFGWVRQFPLLLTLCARRHEKRTHQAELVGKTKFRQQSLGFCRFGPPNQRRPP